MGSSFRLNPRAKADLEGIFLYTLQMWSAAQADRYVLDLEKAFLALAQAPEIGQSIDRIRAGYQKFSVRSNLIIYRRRMHGIEIMRVLHQRMDILGHL